MTEAEAEAELIPSSTTAPVRALIDPGLFALAPAEYTRLFPSDMQKKGHFGWFWGPTRFRPPCPETGRNRWKPHAVSLGAFCAIVTRTYCNVLGIGGVGCADKGGKRNFCFAQAQSFPSTSSYELHSSLLFGLEVRTIVLPRA